MAALGDWWLCSQGGPVDLVPRDFSAQQPGTKVVGDVTYASEHGGAAALPCARRPPDAIHVDAMPGEIDRARIAPFRMAFGQQKSQPTRRSCLNIAGRGKVDRRGGRA
jgi:hypothetical protein